MSSRRLRSVPDAGGIRTVLYVRVSAVMGRDEAGTFHSPDLQLKAIRDMIERRQLREVATVDDIDVSGRTFNRAGIRKVLAMAEAGDIDVVAVYDLSRFGRATAESLRVITQLRELGVSVVSTVEQFDDTPEGQFNLGLFLGLAQLYSDQRSRAWKQVVEHRISQGLQHGGKIPLGYLRAGGGVIQRDPAWAPRILELYERYDGGETLRQIRLDFHRRYGRVARSSLRLMLSNPVYVGRVNLNGRDYPGRHDPIVPAALFDRVQRRLQADAGVPPRTLARSWSLSGLIYCGECGHRLQRRQARSRPAAPLQHRAFCARHSEAYGCAGVGMPLCEPIEAEVLGEIRAKIDGWMITNVERESRKQRRKTAAGDAARLRRAITEDKAALGVLAADRARGRVSDVAYEAAAVSLEESIRSLQGQLGAAEELLDAPAVVATRDAVKTLLELWEPATPSERFRMLRPLIAGVIVTPPTRWRDPIEHRVRVVFTF